jgi:hypothetical protein
LKLIAVDGHDGSGKTTLALALAERVGAKYARPFGGAYGRELIEAWHSGRHDAVMTTGEKAVRAALNETGMTGNWVFDRGWLTVATLVPKDIFATTWTLWFPTALVWCDEPTTRQRLSARASDELEPDDWHVEFLEAYPDRLALHPGPVIRTDLLDESTTLDYLQKAYESAPDLV